jgi:thiamine-phosphate pyrophosphorylase
MKKYHQVIDANLNRVTEGLRVIEEYSRFISLDKDKTEKLSSFRKQINCSEKNPQDNLLIRNTDNDMRAFDPPTKRKSLWQLLKANFKRAEEGLRVLEEYTGESIYNKIRYQLYQLEKEILLPLSKKKINTGVYLISSDVSVLAQGLKDGASIIQLRDKAATKEELLKRAIEIKEVSRSFQVPLIINDFIDIAIVVDSDGFHSGQDDIPIAEQRKLLGEHKIIGRTTHNLEQGLRAQEDGADYISIGPIWETPSKPDRPPIGLEYLAAAKEIIKIPYVAIGAINDKSIDDILVYTPPLVGIIRAHKKLKEIRQKLLKKDQRV